MATSSLFGDINYSTNNLTSPWVDSSVVKSASSPVSSGSSGSSGSSSSSSSKSSSSSSKSSSSKSYDVLAEIKKQKEEAAKRLADQKEEAQSNIADSFSPVFAELDRQLGNLSTVKKQYQDQIAALGDTQASSAEDQRATSLAQLETSKESVDTNTQSSLRSLENDIRNQLKAKAAYFGALGAGDSSATDAASEAVTREGLKSRATVLSEHDQAMADIESQKNDVNTLASQQLSSIESWKAEKLFTIEQDFNDKYDQLSQAKADATSEEKKAIASLITGLNEQFNTRLTQLDDAVTNYKSQISTWEMQRTAELEDYAKKLALSAKYTGGESTAKAQAAANSLFKDSLAQGLDAEAARARAYAQTGVDPLSGLELTDAQKKALSSGDSQVVTNPIDGSISIVNKSTGAVNQVSSGASSSASTTEDEGLLSSILSMIGI